MNGSVRDVCLRNSQTEVATINASATAIEQTTAITRVLNGVVDTETLRRTGKG
jgi:hypothetical protein